MTKKLYEIKENCTSKDLIGNKYTPIFDFFKNDPNAAKSWRVLSYSYITDDAGTGIVHLAPSFGEDDYIVCMEHGSFKKEVSYPVLLTPTNYLRLIYHLLRVVTSRKQTHHLLRWSKPPANLFKKIISITLTHSAGEMTRLLPTNLFHPGLYGSRISRTKL